MMYDTAIPREKFYVKLMADWTRQLAETTRQTGCELIIEIPAYDDAGVGYHRPEEENVASALRGISASSRTGELKGIAIYCEWEMDEARWQIWQKFIRGSAPDMRPEVPPGKPPTGEAAALPMSFCNTVPRMLYY